MKIKYINQDFKIFFCCYFLLLLLCLIFFPTNSLTKIDDPNYGVKYYGKFGGRISKINHDASFIRFRVRYQNIKFFKKGDELEFWREDRDKYICNGKIISKSKDYILVTVPRMKMCLSNFDVLVGSFVKFFSPDLVKNIEVAQEVIDIMLKKKMVYRARLKEAKKVKKTNATKINAINDRYTVLREKMEQERKEEIRTLQDDLLFHTSEIDKLKDKNAEIDKKLERYIINDVESDKDRWALDSGIYIKK